MGRKLDIIKKQFGPIKDKNLKNMLAARIARDFPRIGGPRIQQLCAEMILEVVRQHVRAREQQTHGYLMWMAVPVNAPPTRHQRIRDTLLVPVLLEVSSPDDIDERIQRVTAPRRLQKKAVRLCHQAYEQGGLLSNCDLAEMLCTSDSAISTSLTSYERERQCIVPRRANLHDVGTGLTHKRIICLKRFADGKPAHLIAQETYHHIESVDRYLAQYDRVRCCRKKGMTPEQTAHMLNCSIRLVYEYLAIDDELENQPQVQTTS